MTAETQDALFGGAVALRQPARRAGYRVNADALLLADFAARRRARLAVDLGAGVGAVTLALLHHGAVGSAVLAELDATLAELARRNLEDNGWSERAEVLHGDVAALDLPAGDLVVCNPPYVPPGRGRLPAPPVRRAKYGPLEVFVEAARRAAGRRARVCFVYPAIEATTLLTLLRARGLEPKRLRAVHGRAGEPARVVLVEAMPAKPGGLIVEPPLVER